MTPETQEQTRQPVKDAAASVLDKPQPPAAGVPADHAPAARPTAIAAPNLPAKHYHKFGLLQLIGVFKLLKGIGSVIAALAVLHLIRNAEAIHEWTRMLHIAPGAHRIIGPFIAKLLELTRREWQVIGAVLAAYAVLFTTEGVGLLLNKHWAEWMTVVTTCLLIPLEFYEVLFHFGWAKLATLFINVLAAIYIIVRIRRDIREKHAGRAGGIAAGANLKPS